MLLAGRVGQRLRGRGRVGQITEGADLGLGLSECGLCGADGVASHLERIRFVVDLSERVDVADLRCAQPLRAGVKIGGDNGQLAGARRERGRPPSR